MSTTFDPRLISPELALVDPALARRLRELLPDPPEPAEQPPADESRDPIAEFRECFVPELNAAAPTPADPRRTQAVTPRFTLFRAAVALSGLLILAVGGYIGVELEQLTAGPAGPPAARVGTPSGLPAGARRSIGQARSGGPSAKRSASAPTGKGSAPVSRPSTPSPLRFAWAPTERASGYDVQFYRGSTRVLRLHTTSPRLELARWAPGSDGHSLRPGEYLWYVWPVIDGQRQASAVVQARLVVTAD